jgi:hypothetical protein
MNKVWKLFLTLTITILLLSIATTPVAAQQGGEPPVAEEFVDPEGILFVPVAAFKEIELTVSYANGQVARRTFEGGEYPRFDLGASWCPEVIDGTYTYELRAIFDVKPNPEIRQEECEGRYQQAPVIQNGHFYVLRGSIELRDVQEEGQKRSAASSAAQPISSAGGPSTEPGDNHPRSDSGVFSTSGNQISSAQDICYNDDLIVDGSLCVGFDCTCGYSFGFDTIVLKENNLRIFFDDTSTASSFPRNDWRIIINDSANGGGSYFGVEDATAGRRVFSVEAGAPSHSLYVDDGGRIGVRTSTPSVELHVKDGDTPALRLEQDGSSGFAPQTWDVAGNETNFFIRDVTNGSALPFRIQPGTSSNALTVKSTGIGIGTWSPANSIHVLTNSSTNAKLYLERTSGAQGQVTASASNVQIGAASNHPVRVVANGAWRMEVTAAGRINMAVGGGYYDESNGNWTDGSSREYKENIAELKADEALAAFNDLKPVTYKFKTAPAGDRQVGFIAEDVPELVAKTDRKGLAPMDIVAVLTKVLQEQQKLNREQQKLNQQQQQTIVDLKKRVAELEKKAK